MKPPRFSALFFSIVCLPIFSCLAAEAGSAVAAPSFSTEPVAQSSEERPPASASGSTLNIPGPLRSFLRMAGISQRASREEVLPLLARNVFVLGYEGWESNAHPTEFLVLLMRYVQQARELSGLAGTNAVIRVSSCEEAPSLLHTLGYRLRGACGQPSAALETADAERAFLTTDSGFPLPELEQTLQGAKPFAYPFPSSQVLVLFTEGDWRDLNTANRSAADLLDLIMRDPLLARLYWAMSRVDRETQMNLRQSPGLL